MGLAAVRDQIAPGKKNVAQGGGSLARVRKNLALHKDIRKLEQDLDIEKQGSILERATVAVLGNPVVKRVLDVVSRPNYAVAGVYEEIAAGRGFMSAGQRIGREIFSGVGDVQGEKQGFGGVFQDLGYGEGGSLSGLAPFAFSDTGQGVAFKRGGFFDWTARGSLGTAMDIALDPITYLTLGTGSTARTAVKAGKHYLSSTGLKALRSAFDDGVRRGLLQGEADAAARNFVEGAIDKGAKHLADQGGVKLFGATVIPGEVFSKPAKTVADGVTKFLHKSAAGDKVIEIGEGVGRVFNRDFLVRNHPEYVARKQLYLTTVSDSQRNLREMIEDLYRGTSKPERAAVTNFIDSGGKTAIDPKLTPLVKKTTDIYAQWGAKEQELGLLETLRLDYVFHAYDAHPKRVKDVLARFDPTRLRATVQGSQKHRAFDTLDEAREYLKSQGINPIEDSAELLLRRGLRHIHGVETRNFFTDVGNRFGTLPDTLEAGAAQLSAEMSDIAKWADIPDGTAVAPFGRLQRFEEVGVATSDAAKPQGLYLSPSNVVSPHADLGGVRVEYAASPQNALDVTDVAVTPLRRGAVSVGAGVKALREVVGETEYKFLSAQTKGDLVAIAKGRFPDSDFSRYYDRQDILEALGGLEARRAGYDAFFDRSRGAPDFAEFVALDQRILRRVPGLGDVSAVEKASRRGVPMDEIRALSDEGKKEFLRRRFERVGNPLEMENVLIKYDEFRHLFPETTNQATRALKSFNGERMATLDLPEFKGITVPVDIANDIRDFNKHFINKEEAGIFLRGYDKFMNSFKLGVTSIWPAFHFRNSYSNVVQQFTDVGLSALNPAMHKDAVRMLAGDVNGAFVARHGRRWGYGEVVYEAKRRGVMADYRNVFETFGDKIPIRTGKSRALEMVKHPLDTWKRFGGIVENESRLTLFTNYLRRGLDPETAAARVNKVMFDYHNLSRIERDVLTRVFPFYRWTRKNIALQAERLAKNPGQAAIQAKLTRQQNARPEDLPGYLRGEFVFTLGAGPDGKLTHIRGIDIPIGDLNVMGEPLQLVMGNLSPAVKLLPELMSDRDFFYNRSISENSTPLLKGVGKALDLLPQRVKKIIDFSKRETKAGGVEYRMNPTLAYIVIKSWALSRMYGTAERMLRAKSLASPENFLDITTGIRLQDVDVDVASENLEREYQRFLEKKAIAAGIRKRFSKTFTPKEKKPQ